MQTKALRIALVLGVVALVGTAAGRPASAQSYYVYGNCRVTPCVIGVANQYYAIPGNARYREGWRRISGRYVRPRRAWNRACRLHASPRYNSPDIARGRIRCTGPRPAGRSFGYPRYRGWRVDYCAEIKRLPSGRLYRNGCGRDAARRFCRRMGLRTAYFWDIDSTGRRYNTLHMRSLQRCILNVSRAITRCRGFRVIRCR